MIAVTVHEPPEPPLERLDRADALVFVRDGFSFKAMLFAPLWLLGRQMWLALGAYVALVTALALTGWLFGIDGRWLGLALAALHLLIGFEGDSAQRWTLNHAGWKTLGAVTGRTLDDCERVFFDAWLPAQPMISKRPKEAPTLGALARSQG